MDEGLTPGADDPGPRIGSYLLDHQLGSGGMSSVYRAVHSESGVVVAVKILPRNLARNPSLLQRFLREAKSAEALEHPNISAIYDRGIDHGRHYLVLEFVEGGDLHDRVKLQGPMQIDAAIAVIRSVADGLHFAASRGMIHRDIKPANLLVAPDGRVKIIDLGLALQAESDDERVTRDGTTVGTVDFMAPEQARDSRATSVRSDIYSLGCTFHFLLTGAAPFPGGDIADKLSRHFTQPAPDPRVLRADVPDVIARIVQKMMAKRPERRYQDYDQLRAALDEYSGHYLPTGELSLNALVAEEDAEDEAAERPLTLEPPTEISLAELAELDDEPGLVPIPTARPPAALPRTSRVPVPRPEPEAELSVDALIDEDDEEGKGEADPDEFLDNAELFEDDAEPLGAPSGVGDETPGASSKRTWIVAGAIAAVCALLLGVGVHQLMLGKTADEPVEVAEAPPPPAPEVEAPEPPAPPEPEPMPEPKKPAPRSAPITVVASVVPPTLPVVPKGWVEPEDEATAAVRVEPALPVEREARFLPAWARDEIAARFPGTFATVRRIGDPTDQAQKPTLRLALDAPGGTVQIEDAGPWHESDLRIFGDARMIRSHPGRRAMLCLERAELDAVREQAAPIILDGKALILDGIDLVVDVRDLRRGQTALFLCRGGALTLRNTSITVVNPSNQPFSVIRVEGSPRPSRIRVETSLVRGNALTALELAGGAAEVVFKRSVLVGGSGPLIAATGQEGGDERKVWFLRSLLACRGPLVEIDGAAPKSARANLLSFNALGTTFGRFDGAGGTSLVTVQNDPGADVAPFGWDGDDNRFLGWTERVVTGSNRTVRVPDASAARALWPGSDTRSRDDASPWADPTRLTRLAAGDLVPLAPELGGTLDRVAQPSPFLLEQTVESFPKPIAPTLELLAATATQPALARPEPGSPPPPPPVKELALHVDAVPWRGDIGRFVRDQYREGDRRLRVRVEGSGNHAWSPLRMPPGVSLEVIVTPPTSPDAVPLVWSPAPGAPVEALIDIRGADLRLSGVRIVRGASAPCTTLVRVEDGHLVVERCRLYSSAQGSASGRLIDFHAASTETFARGPGPFTILPDRPIARIVDSVLITAGEALAAEVGKGYVSCSDCLIAASGTAFVLRPARVARGRFDATLALDRSTVAAERSFVVLGRWPGAEPGPDRPWLLTTHDCAFLDQYDRPARDSVLLRVEPDSIARGVLFWQSNNTAFEVAHFTARADLPPIAVRKPDVRRQWIDLWGVDHMRRVTGPSKVGAPPSVRFLARIAVGGAVGPGDLALDPNEHSGRTELDLGADLERLQVRPTKAARRR